MTLRTYLVSIFAVLILVGCGGRRNTSTCEDLLPESSRLDSNKTIELSIPSDINTFKLNDVIEVQANNHAETVIEIAPDQDLKIYIWQANSWSVVANNMDYLSVTERISPNSNDDPGIAIYPILLTLTNQNEPVRVCVILQGIQDPDGSRTEVVAYTEAILNP